MGIIKACCHSAGAIRLGGIYHKKNEDRFADSMSLRGHREGLGLSLISGMGWCVPGTAYSGAGFQRDSPDAPTV